MKLYEILLPTTNTIECRNLHKEWDKKICKISGGLTILKERGMGKWVSEDLSTITETVLSVRIACEPQQMQAIAQITAEHYNQHSVIYYEIGNAYIVKKETHGRRNA